MHLKKLSRHGKRWKANLSSPIYLSVHLCHIHPMQGNLGAWFPPYDFQLGPKDASWMEIVGVALQGGDDMNHHPLWTSRIQWGQSMQPHVKAKSYRWYKWYDINGFFQEIHQLDVEVKKVPKPFPQLFFWECLDPKRGTIKGRSWIYLLTQKQFHWSNHCNKRLPFSILHTMDCRVRGLETASSGTRFPSCWH